ncbi:anti-repressor SinI family protein [Alkalicoccus halolimnae]|uniref:Anti-repressor SinI family protein n=1 Tax=Alkalicoccus halolimnae TaxID=1667239 RepID=A0A5C7FI51_9BACI|nr:anti-repressor SinI family protein [Alkalicoccus halolimnae]TXF85156.1 DNA-binding anti-repressor SinI [Alkalicoccus halolimnae]
MLRAAREKTWAELLREARDMGLTPSDIRSYLDKKADSPVSKSKKTVV